MTRVTDIDIWPHFLGCLLIVLCVAIPFLAAAAIIGVSKWRAFVCGSLLGIVMCLAMRDRNSRYAMDWMEAQSKAGTAAPESPK